MTTFYRLLGFWRPYKRGLAASWVLASVAMVVTVLIPHLTGLAVEAISQGVSHADHRQLAQRAQTVHAAGARDRDSRDRDSCAGCSHTSDE